MSRVTGVGAQAAPGPRTERPPGGSLPRRAVPSAKGGSSFERGAERAAASRRATTPRSSDGLRTTVTPAELVVLFEELAATDIPWGFVDEGCPMRAHSASRWLEARGFHSEKAWCHRVEGSGDLLLEAPAHPLGFTLAAFHLAVGVQVELSPGRYERRILDPSLADVPLTVEEWEGRMRSLDGAPLVTEFFPRFTLMPYQHEPGAPRQAWVDDEVAGAEAWKHEWREVADWMEASGFWGGLLQAYAAQGDAALGLEPEPLAWSTPDWAPAPDSPLRRLLAATRPPEAGGRPPPSAP